MSSFSSCSRPGPLMDDLNRLGESLHHVCFRVPQIDEFVATMPGEASPRTFVGGGGRRACFLKNPPTGTRIELIEYVGRALVASNDVASRAPPARSHRGVRGGPGRCRPAENPLRGHRSRQADLGTRPWCGMLLAGLSGMVASALSMGSGAYLAAKSEREIYHAEIAREREAIQMNGPEARELLSLYYQVKGLPEADVAPHGEPHRLATPNSCCAPWPLERLGASGGIAVESHGLGDFRRAVDRRRRNNSGHSLLLYAGHPVAVIAAAIVLAGRALRRGRSQVAHHRALLVVVGHGNDHRRRG